MKNTLVFTFGFLLLFACKKDPVSLPLTMEDYNSNHLKKYLPIISFENNSLAVFIDKDGNENLFIIQLTYDSLILKSNNKQLNIENIQLKYSNQLDSTFSLNVVTMANNNASNVSFGASYNAFLSHRFGMPYILGFDKKGLANSFTEYNKTLIINNQEYNNVYAKLTINDNNQSIRETYYNHKLGIVGFVDKSHILWSLKEFRK